MGIWGSMRTKATISVAHLVATEVRARFEIVVMSPSSTARIVTCVAVITGHIGHVRRRRRRVSLIQCGGRVRSGRTLGSAIRLRRIGTAHWSRLRLRVSMFKAHSNRRAHHLRFPSPIVAASSTPPAIAVMRLSLLRLGGSGPVLSGWGRLLRRCRLGIALPVGG
jgi:hypothetical protein